MCTAFDVGTIGGDIAVPMKEGAVEALLNLGAVRLVRPTLSAPVIDAMGDCVEMRWGFRRRFSNAVVNAREDKLKGGMWREAMEKRRCLIPAVGYYEWSGAKGAKRTHRFESPAGGWLWIAGIWEEDKEMGKCFSMITTEPKGVAVGVHNRMPAVLSVEETGVFLDGGMDGFSPKVDLLKVKEVVNPLTGRKPGAVQGELF